MTFSSLRISLPIVLLSACTGGVGDAPNAEKSDVAAKIADAVKESTQIAPVAVRVGAELFSLPIADSKAVVNAQSCRQLEEQLYDACLVLEQTGDHAYCYATTTYFLANTTPRCAARVHLGGSLETIYAFDLSGQALSGPIETCGNGELDSDEQCDDGNLEDFDGCDSMCQEEEFQGCEAVIEEYYRNSGLAIVDKNKWDGPRSHLMTNPSAKALAEVNQVSCDAALSIGVDVCNELYAQMPFVSSCNPVGGLHVEGTKRRCDLRFDVGFHSIDPDSGVYTTALSGILAFSIGE